MVFKLNACGNLTTLHAFQGSDGFDPRSSLTPGPSGSFYGTTYTGGFGFGVIFRLFVIHDCDSNQLPDDVDILNGIPDCNSNGIPDACDIASCTSNDVNSNGMPDECETRFHRGDPNSSGTTDISDGISIFGFLFLGDPQTLSCKEAADANNDGTVDISDGVYLLSWLFTGGPEPVTPGPTGAPCGLDPDPVGSAGDLECAVYAPCQ